MSSTIAPPARLAGSSSTQSILGSRQRAERWFKPENRLCLCAYRPRVELKVEEDGDLHIALHDVTGDKPGVVVCEVPAKPQWCEIRTTVFSWTPTRFPFHTGAAKKLTFGQSPIITVIGKASWDVGHAPKDQSNRRKYMPDYAVWEIHPVMKLTVQPSA